jgi:amino acid adenylation domain-containing protein
MGWDRSVPVSGAVVIDDQETRTSPRQYSLGRLQRGLWYLWKLSADDLQDRQAIGAVFDVSGKVDSVKMQSALRHVVARHPNLRARFGERDGEPFYTFAESPLSFEWTSLDHRALDANARDDAESEFLHRGFDLVTGPIFRAALVRLEADQWRIVLAVHHIVGDRRSLYRIVSDVCDAYATASQGPHTSVVMPIRLDDPPAETETSDIAYWKATLEGSTPLQIPSDMRRQSGRTVVAGRERRAIADGRVQQLDDVASTLGVTPFTILLGAFFLTLRKYCGQQDLRVATPSEADERRQDLDAVGLFVNTVVIRFQPVRGQPVGAMLQLLRNTIAEAKRHDATAFSNVVSALRPHRENGSPLFEVMANYVDARRFPKASIPGHTVQTVEERAGLAQFDLSLDMAREPDRLLLFFDYAVDALRAESVAAFADQFNEILDDILASPDTAIDELGIPEWAAVPIVPAVVNPIHDRILKQASAYPDRVALRIEDESMTYGTLAEWSFRIGQALLRHGVTVDTRIGLCVTRGPAMAPAMLGILLVGAAYVPLDPSYPGARLAAMIEDAGIGLIVADTASLARTALLFAGRQVVQADNLPAALDSKVDVRVHPDQAAYVIYTSGSTGTPKGVVITHRAASAHFDDFLTTYGINADSVMLHTSTINFDVALHELLPALTQGGKVVVRGEQPWDLSTLRRRLREERVTFARLPTAYWQMWLHDLESDSASDFPTLRQVTVGGEALAGDALARWRNGPLAHVPLDNLYGPTETTIAALRHRTEAEDASQVTVPIGTPFASRHTVVLDIDDHPALLGASGELCIGGDTLARGYLNRPGLTADRFMPDPFTVGGRLYRSGDLCRRRPDGTVDFLGRIDSQIKLRGFRIELGEIEAAMRSVRGIREAIAIVTGERDHRKIVGYVTGTAPPSEVKRSLEQTLPNYMVPSAVLAIDSMPLMPNGKLDRERLPAPEVVERRHAPPENDIERRLASLWGSLLNRDDLDRESDFFELGGHSLMALRLIARVESEFGHAIGLAAFFKAPTISAFAKVLADTSAHEFDFRQVVQMHPHSSKPPLFALNSTGTFFHLGKLLGPSYPLVGLQLFDPSQPPSQTPTSLEDIATEYVEIICRTQSEGPYHLLGHSVGGVLAFEVAQQLKARGAEVAFLGILDTWSPGYVKRLEAHRALIFHAVIRGRKRWQKACRIPMIVRELCRFRGRKDEFVTFLAHHHTVARRFFPSYAERIAAELARNPQTQYDTWLRDYLDRVAAAYIPTVYRGQIHLFRAALEARPPLSDPWLGWEALSSMPLRRANVAANHESICRPPGVSDTAIAVADAIEKTRVDVRLA